MKLGFGELLIIFVVILFIVGPDKIPSFAKKLGEGLKAFRNATSDVTKELKENVVDPLNEASAPIREAMEPLAEMKDEINKSMTDLKRDMTSLNNSTKAPGKNAPKGKEDRPEGESAKPPAAEESAKAEEPSVSQPFTPAQPESTSRSSEDEQQ